MKNPDFVLDVLRVLEDIGLDDWFVFVRDDEVHFAYNTNDTFAYACADLAVITPDNLDLLKRSIADCDAIIQFSGCGDGPLLWASRLEGRKPIDPVFNRIRDKLKPLFEAVEKGASDAD